MELGLSVHLLIMLSSSYFVQHKQEFKLMLDGPCQLAREAVDKPSAKVYL